MMHDVLSGTLGVGAISPIFVILMTWSLIWKGIGLWKSGRNNHVWWFVAIFVLNTFGILPIIYLAFFQKKSGKGKLTRKVAKRTVKKRKK
tara:strand:- start:3894 stop:4163 length:270 start_codon:yes stop_codon:yes gene_type:complete